MNRQVQPGGNIGEPEENSLQESVQMTESEQSAEYSRGRNINRWLFLGILASVVVVLWVFDLFPSILYVDTIGSLGSLLPMIPRIDLEIIVIIWMAALFFGLVARGVRHASRAHRG